MGAFDYAQATDIRDALARHGVKYGIVNGCRGFERERAQQDAVAFVVEDDVRSPATNSSRRPG